MPLEIVIKDNAASRIFFQISSWNSMLLSKGWNLGFQSQSPLQVTRCHFSGFQLLRFKCVIHVQKRKWTLNFYAFLPSWPIISRVEGLIWIATIQKEEPIKKIDLNFNKIPILVAIGFTIGPCQHISTGVLHSWSKISGFWEFLRSLCRKLRFNSFLQAFNCFSRYSS